MKWAEEQQGKHICNCGCGGTIKVTSAHYPNAPEYLRGHNPRSRPEHKPLLAPTPCECGCGALAKPGRRFIAGHNAKGRKVSAETRRRMSERMTGERNPRKDKPGTNWKGGRTCTALGYIAVWAPDHPHSKGRYILEHRLVMEEALRRHHPASEFLVDGHLDRGADVHHVNGIKDDNRLENLDVMWRSEHARLHATADYPAEWFDGTPRLLRVGVDVASTDFHAVRRSLDTHARHLGLRVSCKHIDDTHFTLLAVTPKGD